MREQRTLGSVRGAVSNGRPYRDSLSEPREAAKLQSVTDPDYLHLQYPYHRLRRTIT